MALRTSAEPAISREDAATQRLLRVLQVVEATFAGVGRHVLDLSRDLLERGHNVHMAYSPVRMEARFAAERRALEALGLRSFPLPMQPRPGLRDVRSIAALRRYLRLAGPFDVVHGHSSKGGAVARLAAVGLRTRRIYTPHAFKTLDPTLSCAARVVYGGVELLLARHASDTVVCVAEAECCHALALGVPPQRLVVLPNTVRVPDDVPDRAAARARFGLTAADEVIIWIGRLAPQKAPERFVALIERLAVGRPATHGLMLGYGELEGDVRRRIAAAGLSSRLHLVTDARGWDGLAAADLLVMTSRYEAQPYVLLEAAALSVPFLVQTDAADAEFVDRVGRWLALPPGDHGRLAAAPHTFPSDGAMCSRLLALYRGSTTRDNLSATRQACGS